MPRFFGAVLALAIFSQAAKLSAQTAPSDSGPLITAQQTTGTPDQRAGVLIRQLTLDEKISLLGGARDGFSTQPIDRLGIGSFHMSDGPQGVRNGPGTPAPRACAFPCGAALAATFDPDLAAAYGKAIGLEDRARGSYYQLGPGVNICRVPVNGRNFEYFGEDPYLASIIAVNWVKNCAAQGAIPTIKHFAGNNQENNRNSVDARIDERTLNEIYLPAFKKAATEGGNIAFMCSYNRLNGDYASNNDWLLNQMLKQRWGFKGLVMSDWGASHQVSDLARGLDLEMPNGANLSPAKIKAALADGTLRQSDIDAAVHRILRSEIAEGWLDAGWQQKNADLPMDSADSAKTALDVARAAIVLLKNDGDLLPLDRSKIKTLVVLGPNATAPVPALAAGTTAPTAGRGGGGRGNEPGLPLNIGGGGSGAVLPFPNRYAEADYLKGITKAAGPGVKVIYLPAPDQFPPDMYNTLTNARTDATGAPGLTLTVQVTGDGAPVEIAPSTQPAINLSWQNGQLPLGVPAGRDATYTWTGVLVSPVEGDWQIITTGNPTIHAGGKALDVPAQPLVHLQKNNPTPITIEYHALANPPARGGRGRNGAGAGRSLQVALVPPAIPDLSAVKDADAAIVCVGLNRNVEAEGRDRAFDLPQIQQYLIAAVAAANPHTIVINNSGAAVGIAAWQKSAAAILQAWYLGQEGGIAVGETLFGDSNPSGKLCSTFDKSFEDNPAFKNYPGSTEAGAAYPTENYEEGIFYGYRGYDKAAKEPLYPFGYGLSYTTFDLSNLKISEAGQEMKVSLDVKNTGKRAGAEVVQIYVGEQSCPIPRPLRELKGFRRVMLNPGESQHIEIALPRDSFAYWSPDKKDWTVDSGNRFNIEAGVSERDIKLKETVNYGK